MDPERFDTRSLPVSQQFEAWNQWYGPVYDTTPHRPAREGYAARNLTWRLDGFAFSRVAAPAIDGFRNRTHIRRNPVDHWVITLTKRGTHKVSARGIVAEPGIGVPLVQSLADPMESQRSDYDRVQLYLARDDFGEIAELLDASRDVPLDTPAGKLLGEYLLLIERSLPALQDKEVQNLKGAIRAMVAACVKPTADRLVAAAVPITLSRLGLARRAVERHLHDPTLGASLLCAELGMSRSQLYRLFDGEGGVNRYIQRRRLAAAHACLSDATNTKPISQVAFELCFSDASMFSRAFRREFGLSASDLRSASLTDLTSMATTNDRIASEPANFGELIRSFR